MRAVVGERDAARALARVQDSLAEAPAHARDCSARDKRFYWWTGSHGDDVADDDASAAIAPAATSTTAADYAFAAPIPPLPLVSRAAPLPPSIILSGTPGALSRIASCLAHNDCAVAQKLLSSEADAQTAALVVRLSADDGFRAARAAVGSVPPGGAGTDQLKHFSLAVAQFRRDVCTEKRAQRAAAPAPPAQSSHPPAAPARTTRVGRSA